MIRKSKGTRFLYSVASGEHDTWDDTMHLSFRPGRLGYSGLISIDDALDDTPRVVKSFLREA
jgi:hypothetical protein